MTNVNKEKLARIKKFLFGGLKSFVKNLLFFVELWLRQVFSDSCLYILEFSPWPFIIHTCALLAVLESYFFFLVASVQIHCIYNG